VIRLAKRRSRTRTSSGDSVVCEEEGLSGLIRLLLRRLIKRQSSPDTLSAHARQAVIRV
jgi:hypothetical protein